MTSETQFKSEKLLMCKLGEKLETLFIIKVWRDLNASNPLKLNQIYSKKFESI